MANVAFYFFGWVSTNGDMAPGDVHNWWSASYAYGDAISLTASPVIGDPGGPVRELTVSNVRMDGNNNGTRTLLWSVKNTGTQSIQGYGIGISVVNS